MAILEGEYNGDKQHWKLASKKQAAIFKELEECFEQAGETKLLALKKHFRNELEKTYMVYKNEYDKDANWTPKDVVDGLVAKENDLVRLGRMKAFIRGKLLVRIHCTKFK